MKEFFVRKYYIFNFFIFILYGWQPNMYEQIGRTKRQISVNFIFLMKIWLQRTLNINK